MSGTPHTNKTAKVKRRSVVAEKEKRGNNGSLRGENEVIGKRWVY